MHLLILIIGIFIEVHKECKNISKIVEANKQINLIPKEYELSIIKSKSDITELQEEECFDNRITFKDRNLIRRSTNLRLPNKKYLGETSNIKEIILRRSVGNMKIKGEYYNEREKIIEQNILIDTGASTYYIALIGNKGLPIYETTPYRYMNFNGQSHITNLDVKVPIIIGGIELMMSCYIDNSMNINPCILLGMSFQNKLEDYGIKRE